MIHVVTLDNQHLYGRQLDQMFRMRHAYYIDGLGWAGLSGRNGLEIDEFDDGGVVYLMSIDPWGEVAASVRLNPTIGPTLLGKFSDWSDEPLPAGGDVWDISRWIAAPKHRRASNPRWPSNHQRDLMVGILEFCQSRGLSRLTTLAESRLAERIASYGWPLRQLGAPQAYEGGKGVAVAAEIVVDQHVLALTRHKTGIFGEVLVEVDPSRLPTPAAHAASPSSELRDAIIQIGVAPLRRLTQAVANEIAGAAIDDKPRALELVAALNRLVEATSTLSSREVERESCGSQRISA